MGLAAQHRRPTRVRCTAGRGHPGLPRAHTVKALNSSKQSNNATSSGLARATRTARGCRRCKAARRPAAAAPTGRGLASRWSAHRLPLVVLADCAGPRAGAGGPAFHVGFPTRRASSTRGRGHTGSPSSWRVLSGQDRGRLCRGRPARQTAGGPRARHWLRRECRRRRWSASPATPTPSLGASSARSRRGCRATSRRSTGRTPRRTTGAPRARRRLAPTATWLRHEYRADLRLWNRTCL